MLPVPARATLSCSRARQASANPANMRAQIAIRMALRKPRMGFFLLHRKDPKAPPQYAEFEASNWTRNDIGVMFWKAAATFANASTNAVTGQIQEDAFTWPRGRSRAHGQHDQACNQAFSCGAVHHSACYLVGSLLTRHLPGSGYWRWDRLFDCSRFMLAESETRLCAGLGFVRHASRHRCRNLLTR